MGMSRKLRRKKAKMKNDNNFLEQVEKMLGTSTSTKVGEKNEDFSSGRIKKEDRVSYKSPSEKDLLVKFKKTVLVENFKRISDFAELNLDFEERFLTEDRLVDIQAVNNDLTQEEIYYYFKECEDTGMDLINQMADLASYAKNKDYLELQQNILTAAKKAFKPKSSDSLLGFIYNPENMNDIIKNLKFVQLRYVSGAPYLASVKKIGINSIEKRTKAFMLYNNNVMDSLNDLPFSLNDLPAIFKNESLYSKKKRSRFIMNEIIGLNAEFELEILGENEEELIEQLKTLIEKFKEQELKLKVIPETMINENGVLDYSLAKQAFKNSGLKLGSTDDYLKILKQTYSKMIALINSISEIIIKYSFNNKSINKSVLLIEKELDIDINNPDFYNNLMDKVEESASKFVVFCEEKQLNWTNEISIRKAASKFDKSWKHKVYKQELNEANKIYEKMLNNLMDTYSDESRILKAAIETDKFVENRDFLYTMTMLDMRRLIKDFDYNEDKLLSFIKNNTLLKLGSEAGEEEFEAFLFVKYFINERGLINSKFDSLTKSEKEEVVLVFKWFINKVLILINNTVSIYYFAEKAKFKKVEKQITDNIDLIISVFKEPKEGEENLTYLDKLEYIVKLVPDILIFASRKNYDISVDSVDKLNTLYLTATKK